MFIKRKNGYVVPVELYIKFHYSLDFRYTFLAIINPFHEMSPFTNSVKYNINQLLFLLVEDEIEGRLTEHSENLPQILSRFGLKEDRSEASVSKRITDLIADFDYAAVRNTRVDRYSRGEIYEAIHQIDLSLFASE
jgi:hypothetical protein